MESPLPLAAQGVAGFYLSNFLSTCGVYKLLREQVKTIIFRYVFIYYNRVRIYTRNPLRLPPAKYREWAQAQTAA